MTAAPSIDAFTVTTRVDRAPADAIARFEQPLGDWFPVIVGPDEGTWRTETSEGPIAVGVLLRVGDPWVPGDGTYRRRLVVEPDRTSFRNLITASLTPRVEGHLRLCPGSDHAELVFEGRTVARSALTGWLERRLLGTPLGRSSIETLLEAMARGLERAPEGTP